MIFCSLVAYNPDDPRREWSERCLATLLKQLETDDGLLKAETPRRSWEDCLACKVRLACSALEFADDFVCLVDTDILFRDGWVKALKGFLSFCSPKEPIVAALPEWTADGTYDFNEEWVIQQQIEWGGLPIKQPRFYLNAGIVVISVGAKEFVRDWMAWTLKASALHEQTALCYLLHQRGEQVKVIFLPETLHYIHPFLPDFEAVIPYHVLAVHAIGSLRAWLWRQLVEGRFEIVGQKVAIADRWRAKKRYGEALVAYREAIEGGEDLSRAYLGIGACHLAIGQIDEAIAAYRQALRLRPDYPEALRQLGECYERQGNYIQAFDCYRRAWRAEPSNEGNKVKIGALLRRLLRETRRVQG